MPHSFDQHHRQQTAYLAGSLMVLQRTGSVQLSNAKLVIA